MSSDSDSSFDLLDSDASSDFSMESFDDVKVEELDSFDSSFEEEAVESSSGDALIQDGPAENQLLPTDPEESDEESSSEALPLDNWRQKVSFDYRDHVVRTIAKEKFRGRKGAFANAKILEEKLFKTARTAGDYFAVDSTATEELKKRVEAITTEGPAEETWRNKIKPGLRTLMVEKLVESLNWDNRYLEYIDQLTEVAQECEQKCFDASTDLEDYYHWVATRIYRMQKLQAKEKAVIEETKASGDVEKDPSQDSLEQAEEASEPTPSIREPAKDTESPSILQEIQGTWKLVSLENIAEYNKIFDTTTHYSNNASSHVVVDVKDSNLVISEYAESGVLLFKRTVHLEAKNPKFSMEEYTHDYIENNEWVTVRQSGLWNKKMIRNGQLRIEYFYGPSCSTSVFDKTSDEFLLNQDTKESAELEVSKTPTSSQNIKEPSVDVAETTDSSEPKTTTPLSESESSKLQTSSETTDASETLKSPKAEQDKPIARPFIEEIIGCWKVVSYHKAHQIHQKAHQIHPLPANYTDLSDFTGTILKINVTNNQFESHKYDKSGDVLKFNNFFQITSKHPYPQLFSYRIENNQLISVYRCTSRLDKAWIQDGKLQIERDNGRIKLVLKKIEVTRKTTPSSTPSPITEKIIFFLFYCLIFLIGCFIGSLIVKLLY